MSYCSTKQALPNIDEIEAARGIASSRKSSHAAPLRKRKRDGPENGLEDGMADMNDEGEEPARKKGAVDNASRVANEIELRALMMN